MSFSCSANIHTYSRYQPVHRHECPRMTEKFCMDCVVQGYILHCRFCNTELEPNRCLYCNWSVGDVVYVQLSCKANHKICRSCFKQCQIRECRTARHTYCETCHRSKAAAFAKCCDDVCYGCNREFAEFDGGGIHLSSSGARYCDDCAHANGLVSRRGK
jgi:hypothetical protein